MAIAQADRSPIYAPLEARKEPLGQATEPDATLGDAVDTNGTIVPIRLSVV
jgi:hypothetical protein